MWHIKIYGIHLKLIGKYLALNTYEIRRKAKIQLFKYESKV